ncbi:hypothetical protein BWI97_14335 [Siphonobacter sp. BAB-5405]|nr:hypothetical protein BWI97_14335 [Siphonobacter sp. BAB-5405]
MSKDLNRNPNESRAFQYAFSSFSLPFQFMQTAVQSAGISKTELADFLGITLPTFRRRITESGLHHALPKLAKNRATIYGTDVPIIEQHFGRCHLLRCRFNLN